MLAKIYSSRVSALTSTVERARSMLYSHLELTSLLDVGYRYPISRLEAANATTFITLQPAPERPHTGQLDQQRLVYLDHDCQYPTTLVAAAYIIGSTQYSVSSPMSRNPRRVPINLDTRGLKKIPDEELCAVLRGADDIVGRGGRSLLKLILRGSQAKAVRKLGLDESPVHGFFRELPNEDVLARIDWAILNGYLKIFYDGRLPLLEFTSKGWDIEREKYADELLAGFEDLIRQRPPFDMEYLKDRDRQMILQLLDKVASTGDARYVPVLLAWRKTDHKKVRQRIGEVIHQLERQKSTLSPHSR